MQKHTPAMQQYVDLKQQYNDCILFFRLGDFYEVFWEDAQLCSKLLDLVLTAKHKTTSNPIPMAGMPYHSVDKYIAKLIRAGYKVAIADQITEARPGQIVERAVTSIVTPGTYIDEKQVHANYMLSISTELKQEVILYHLTRGDFIAGEYRTTTVDNIMSLHQIINTLAPKEIILHKTSPDIKNIAESITTQQKTIIAYWDMLDDPEVFTRTVLKIQSLASFGKALSEKRVSAFALLLSYLITTQQKTITTIYRISYYNSEDYVILDEVTIKNLELFSSSYDHNAKYSLFQTLDQCQSSSGSKLLQHILSHPSKNISFIQERQLHIAYWLEHWQEATSIKNLIGSLYDIPRLLMTLIYKKPHYQYFVRLRSSLESILYGGEGTGCQRELLVLCPELSIESIINLYTMLSIAIKETEILSPNDTEYIRDAYDKKVDECRHLVHNTDQILLDYHQQLVQYTQINDLKIVFVKNQGYLIEVTPKHIATIESNIKHNDDFFDFERRQSLKSGQRYTTPYLETLQEKILSAKDDLSKQEFHLLEQLQENISGQYLILAQMSETLAYLDVYTSHALLVRDRFFVQATITRNKGISIIGGRHPVIEAHLPPTESFIPNDLTIDQNIHIITGPNMGGKSTFLRQHAIIVLLAHCGLFVPAREAKIGLVDGIFARVGSGDVIAKNQSTFMTEMIEVSNIIHNATKHSFVIFDELGRGTSTYDGLSITRAIIEHFATHIQCKVLLATHYHELISLADEYKSIINFHVGVYESEQEVVFLKKILPGGMSKSYGLEVARLAGISSDILQKAKHYLQSLELQKTEQHLKVPTSYESSLFALASVDNHDSQSRDKIKTLLETIDINYLTPIQAMQTMIKISELRKKQ